jgi:hypothetical protein
MEKLNLIRLADIKEYIGLLDKEEITMSKFADILNNCANSALRKQMEKDLNKEAVQLINRYFKR